jgi:hypothetical protein
MEQAGGSATSPTHDFYSSKINVLNGKAWPAPALVQCWYAKNRNFVMARLTKNPRLNEACSKADSKAGSQYGWE